MLPPSPPSWLWGGGLVCRGDVKALWEERVPSSGVHEPQGTWDSLCAVT